MTVIVSEEERRGCENLAARKILAMPMEYGTSQSGVEEFIGRIISIVPAAVKVHSEAHLDCWKN